MVHFWGFFHWVQYLVLFLVPPLPGFQAIRTVTVTCKLYWSLIGRRKSSLLRHRTCDTRPNIDPLDLNPHSQRRIGRNFCLNKRTFLYQPKKGCFVVCGGSTDIPLVDSRGADPARAWWGDAEGKSLNYGKSVEEKDAQQLRDSQPYEDCQAKSIQEFGWSSQRMDWGWGQGIKSNTHRRVEEFGYSCHQRLLTWAKEKNWTVAQWSKVLFSDESKFCISFGNQGPKVWRKGGEAHSPSCLKSSVFTVCDDLGCNVICWCWSICVCWKPTSLHPFT